MSPRCARCGRCRSPRRRGCVLGDRPSPCTKRRLLREAYATRFELPSGTGWPWLHSPRKTVAASLTPAACASRRTRSSSRPGSSRKPHVPDLAQEIDPGIRQLHSSEYRNPRRCHFLTRPVLRRAAVPALLRLDAHRRCRERCRTRRQPPRAVGLAGAQVAGLEREDRAAGRRESGGNRRRSPKCSTR